MAASFCFRSVWTVATFSLNGTIAVLMSSPPSKL